jgi:hypothetical protein
MLFSVLMEVPVLGEVGDGNAPGNCVLITATPSTKITSPTQIRRHPHPVWRGFGGLGF